MAQDYLSVCSPPYIDTEPSKGEVELNTCGVYFGRFRCSLDAGHSQTEHGEHFDKREGRYFGVLPTGTKWDGGKGDWETVKARLEENKPYDPLAKDWDTRFHGQQLSS